MENLHNRLIVSHAPHITSEESVRTTMMDVIIALLPALIAGIIIMGYRAAVVTVVCVGACVGFEWLWCRMLKKVNPVGDLSAVVTGLLLAYNLPVTVPLWIVIIGAFFAIIIVKQFFGGIGHNFMNPALAARAFLLTSWAAHMTSWAEPFQKLHLFNNIDAVTQATPLALLKSGAAAAELPSYLQLFLGSVGGCIGETSALAILLGAAYLLLRKVISPRVPIAYLATVGVLTFIFGGQTLFGGDWLYHLLSGGLMLGAFFMATDYTTTPFTPRGQIIFGIGCGILTAVIRIWGGYPEGVSYSILLMNVASPLIDRFTAPKRFGRKEAKALAE